MTEISNRLLTVARAVTPGRRVADIGTDHGYVPIWLAERDIIPSAIAMDVNRGPLERAYAHIRESGLQDRIETRLSDGLAALGQDEAVTLVIAWCSRWPMPTSILTVWSRAYTRIFPTGHTEWTRITWILKRKTLCWQPTRSSIRDL